MRFLYRITVPSADALLVGASLLAILDVILDRRLSRHLHCRMVYSQRLDDPGSE